MFRLKIMNSQISPSPAVTPSDTMYH